MNEEITPAQRRALRAKAHGLHPVVLIGDKGLSEAVLHEIEVNLTSHELIKVRAQSEREEREAMLAQICERLSAQCVQHIGKVLVIYRERPAELPDSKQSSARRGAPPPARARAPAAQAPATRKAQSKRAADRARKRVSAERGPAAKPNQRRARTR
jgi:RNA-binding protein